MDNPEEVTRSLDTIMEVLLGATEIAQRQPDEVIIIYLQI